ncbi:hypothetical protein [Legionella pneumophila]|uniref:hypothetical protein n=1 Tax=Legionella pneumophila TaxID=446 RepID=UPI001A34FC53|nr:hypothetical protein [Legionella pneumophila]MCW8402000.1 hypothetical protein [Legionella pneumophila]MCZ4712401.1 hypothetical protein [Legionella pneumophila]MCZ4744948.1 hypothetical protein [Legionella pneumophila]MCZ4765190.1 hypothetical protein [Legionella pneumophila]MCZ4777002.1 hypothetical protein [Legionella pneumophila]
MNWLNKNHGSLMFIAVVIFSAWNIYLTYKTSAREESNITQKADKLMAKLEERVERAQKDIEKAGDTAQMLDNKINEIDKKLAVIEEKLKNATTKSLMAAGASQEQALQFWENKSTYIIPLIQPQQQMKIEKSQ